MILTIQRTLKNSKAIIGKLSIDGVFECYTLEGPTVDIPAGSYSMEVTYSPHFGCVLPLLDAVPGRSAIRIHPGNTEKDTEGCILVGTRHTDTALEQSRLAFSLLFGKISNAIDKKEPITITLQDAPTA